MNHNALVFFVVYFSSVGENDSVHMFQVQFLLLLQPISDNPISSVGSINKFNQYVALVGTR